jgi:hypothetical protein
VGILISTSQSDNIDSCPSDLIGERLRVGRVQITVIFFACPMAGVTAARQREWLQLRLS